MGDLISRRKMIELVNNHINEIEDKDVKEVYESFINFINRQPTAYDVEKVVAELERNRSVFEKQNVLPLVNMDYAVKVVKRGGVE